MTLRRRLVERIRANGPISFAEYVEAALYDPAAGFYARGPRLGLRGAFSTAPTRQERFSDAVAAEVRECHRELGAPARYALIEAGPGDGALARALAEQLGDVVSELVLVERAAGMRALQEEMLAGSPIRTTWAESPDDVEVDAGFVVANELFDALSFHLVEWPHEVVVGAGEDDRLREELAPLPEPLAEELRRHVEPRPGDRYCVRPGARAFLLALAGAVERGRLLVADYGGEGEEVHSGRHPVRTFVGGMAGAAPLEAPGSQDITADVDFGALRVAAREAGLLELEYEAQEAWRGRRAPGHAGLFEPAPDRFAAFRILLLARP